MADSLADLADWAEPLLAKLGPAARRQLAGTLARKLRTSQRERIAAQKTPDGKAYRPRKIRNKRGRVKRRAMFVKLRQNRYLKARGNSTEVAVGFFGRVARIARVHQYGLRDKVSPKGPAVKYPERSLLGYAREDLQMVEDMLIDHLVE